MNTAASANPDLQLARLAGAIAEPARARMLSCLMDGHARTATELATVAEVAPSTASAHLARLKEERLVALLVQGKHRYFRLADDDVAAALEGLMVVAGAPRVAGFKPSTPSRLRSARTCYDHMAGTAGVALHDRLHADSVSSCEDDRPPAPQMLSCFSHGELLHWPYSDRSSRDRPQKTMTPIAAMTRTMSNVSGAKVLTCFIASPLSREMPGGIAYRFRAVITL